VATHAGGQPHQSLVAIAATDDLRHLVFCTTRASRKYRNLSCNDRVAVLVDNRSGAETDFSRAVAVTGYGRARGVADTERAELRRLFLRRHLYLEDFTHSPSTELIKVRMARYSIVRRFQNVTELYLDA
jgi:nitroimidazol reductase NimA-like FMN-containing flavoprotein (pyridoxamine 5'-phosphate oxidase superfamily)